MKTIGEFYREKVLSLPKKLRTKREAPYSSLENMKIEMLFNNICNLLDIQIVKQKKIEK